MNYIDIFKTLWDNKFTIISLTFISACISVYVAINSKVYFISDATLSVVESSSSKAMPSGLNALASLGGISLGGAQEDKAFLAIEIIQSKDFFQSLIKDQEILVKLHASKKFNTQNQELIFDDTLYNKINKAWVSGTPNYQDVYKDSYIPFLDIYKDKKNGFIRISFMHASPLFAKEFLDVIIEKLNNSARERDKNLALNSFKYLEKAANENPNNAELSKTFSSLMQQEMSKIVLADVTEDYLLRIIDTPYIPVKKALPNRTQICIFGTFFGAILSVLLVFLRVFINSHSKFF